MQQVRFRELFTAADTFKNKPKPLRVRFSELLTLYIKLFLQSELQRVHFSEPVCHRNFDNINPTRGEFALANFQPFALNQSSQSELR